MDAGNFAKEWQAGWNSHDLDRILSHYREDIVFRSRKAITISGCGEITGKAGLRAYWEVALDRQRDLRFEVRDVFEGHDMLVITYTNHRGVLAAETLYFDPDGQVFLASACHSILDAKG